MTHVPSPSPPIITLKLFIAFISAERELITFQLRQISHLTIDTQFSISVSIIIRSTTSMGWCISFYFRQGDSIFIDDPLT